MNKLILALRRDGVKMIYVNNSPPRRASSKLVVRALNWFCLLGGVLAGRDGLTCHRSLLLGWKFYDSFSCERSYWKWRNLGSRQGLGIGN